MSVTYPRAASAPASGTGPTGLRAWLALAVLTLPTLLVSIDNTVLGVALPAISAALRPDATTLLWVVDVYPLVLAGLLVTMGTLGDRIGRRRLLLVGVAGFGLVSLAAAYATDAVHLVAARALLGFFGAMLMPSTLALLRSVFTDRARRRTALAVWATGFAAGAALGPIVGGVLLEHFWWGSVFVVNVPVMVLLLVAGRMLLPESRIAGAERLDLLGALLSLLTMVPLVLAVKLVGSDGVTVAAGSSLLAGIGAGWAFVVRARSQVRVGRRPLIDLGLFAAPVLRYSALANATTMFGLTGLLFFSAQYLQLVLGRSPWEAGMLLLPGFVATVLAGLAAARLARRVPLHVLVAIGLTLALAGYLACLWLRVDSAVALLVAAAVLIGTGIGLSETVTNDAILAAAPPERAGAASAVSETAYEIGAVFGTAVLGGVLSAVYRSAVTVPDGAPAEARETLGGAVQAGSVLPSGPGAQLLASAREAFALGVDVAAGTGAVVLAVVLAVAGLGLRRAHRTPTPVPTPAPPAPGPGPGPVPRPGLDDERDTRTAGRDERDGRTRPPGTDRHAATVGLPASDPGAHRPAGVRAELSSDLVGERGSVQLVERAVLSSDLTGRAGLSSDLAGASGSGASVRRGWGGPAMRGCRSSLRVRGRRPGVIVPGDRQTVGRGASGDPAARRGEIGTSGVARVVHCAAFDAEPCPAGARPRAEVSGAGVPHEMVSAYTLVIGEDSDPPSVTVHTTADDAWAALDRQIRERCGMRRRPWRVVDSDNASRLADAWRAADPDTRYWQVTAHRLPIMLPELARPRAAVARCP